MQVTLPARHRGMKTKPAGSANQGKPLIYSYRNFIAHKAFWPCSASSPAPIAPSFLPRLPPLKAFLFKAG
jgi:hypothetical protein